MTTAPPEPDLRTPLTTDYYAPSRVLIRTTATTTGTGRGATTDAHTGWHCPHGASLFAGITGPGRGTLPAYHGVIYVCSDHQAEAEARITAAGHQPATEPASPGHRHDPWPCGHITTHGGDGPHLAHTLTTPPGLAAITRILAARIPGADPANMTVTITEHDPVGGTNTWTGTLTGLAATIRDAIEAYLDLPGVTDEDGSHIDPDDLAGNVLAALTAPGTTPDPR